MLHFVNTGLTYPEKRLTLYFLSGGPFLTGAISGSCNMTKGDGAQKPLLNVLETLALNVRDYLIYQDRLTF